MLETPITASNVSRNGCKIYYKRDDLIPFSLGGNKARIVYEYLKDMKEKGCDTIVGYGNDKSNLCRVIAAAAARGAAARESLAEKGGTDALNVCSGGGQ